MKNEIIKVKATSIEISPSLYKSSDEEFSGYLEEQVPFWCGYFQEQLSEMLKDVNPGNPVVLTITFRAGMAAEVTA